MRSIKRLIVGVATGVAIAVGAAPAWAVAEKARDDAACAYQQASPSCQPDGFHPPGDGTDFQHNETLVHDLV
jgi:hypothetical protein